METDKFEQHIRTKLNEREISPSNEAWSKISKELHQVKTSRKSGYFWIGIAASIVVLLGTTIFFLNSEVDEDRPEVEIVTAPIMEVKEKILDKDPMIIEEEHTARVEETVSSSQKNRIPTEEVSEQKEFIVIENKDIALAAPQTELIDSKRTIAVPEDILNSKIAELIAKVDVLELASSVSDAEVDSLLLKAQQDIIKENFFNSDQSVNAMALLTEVEEELDQSFRDQIFKTLKDGFLKVRTAVADRNK